MISAVLLNWKRPENVARVLAMLRGDLGDLVDDVIVWNNHGRSAGFAFSKGRGEGLTIVNASRDMGLHTRFAAACFAKNEGVLLHDDDLLAKPRTVRALVDAWRAEPELVHGIFGRRLTPGNEYAENVVAASPDKPAAVPIVLTRVLVFHRDYAPNYLANAHRFDAIFQQYRKPFGNGEDILLSYTARKATGRLNKVHRLPVVELPAGPKEVGIHSRDWSGHCRHRTRLCRALEQWLVED